MPLFEDTTPETILERILSRMETDLQTREGSYAYDQAAPISFEIWRVLMTLDELIEAFYVNENSGPYLDAHARLFAMSRREGSRAAAKMTFTGQDGTVVPAGSIFYAGGALEFRMTVVLESTASLPAVEAAFVSKLDAYLADAAFEEFTVYANRVGALLISIDGVVDYDGLTLNGSGDNLVLGEDGVPVRGRVVLT